jgi:mandelate racemase
VNNAMAHSADSRVAALTVRVVNPPLAVPHTTAGGVVASYPMVLLDLHTSAGITGCAYVFTYTVMAAPAVARLLRDIAPIVVGQPCAPRDLHLLLRKRFRLLGPHGFTAMVMAAIDMAAWDVQCKAAGLPLHAMLGAAPRGLRAYAPVGLAGVEGSVREAKRGLDRGFKAVKAKIGYATLAEDLAVLHALRELLQDAVGPEAALMADYNQAFDVPEVTRRIRAIEGQPEIALTWIEEPVCAEDFVGHAQVRAAVQTPVQAGENWWGALEFQKAISAGASTFLMPDVMKLGGITPWLDVAALASAHGLPLSNHLFAEVSAHLMAASATAHWFEWCDWSEPVLSSAVEVRDGNVWPGNEPGIGVAWNEAAVAQHLVVGA